MFTAMVVLGAISSRPVGDDQIKEQDADRETDEMQLSMIGRASWGGAQSRPGKMTLLSNDGDK